MDTEYILETRLQFHLTGFQRLYMGTMTDLECFPLQCDKDVWAPDINGPHSSRPSRTVDGNTQT